MYATIVDLGKNDKLAESLFNLKTEDYIVRNYIKYNIRIEGVFFEEITCNFNGVYIKNILLKKEETEKNANIVYEMTLELDRNTDEGCVKNEEFIKELNSIVNKIKLFTKQFVSNPVFVESRFCCEDGEARNASFSVGVTPLSSGEDIASVKKAIESSNVISNNLLLFLNTLSVENHYARFILLYGILYDLVGTELDVDDYIKQYFNDVSGKPEMKISRNNPKKQETIYTYLRNYYGHMNDIDKINEINIKTNEVINEFTELVYQKLI